MDIQQLKLLAGRLRGIAQQHDRPISHGQALDLIAALPGLRNWPEVSAFPDRVAACQLDLPAAGRLAYRLKHRNQLDLSPDGLCDALRPPDQVLTLHAPQIWPSGPIPGVYVTASQDAVNALLARYEEATDGALVYAERAGNHWDGSIDLGEHGLWSNGMDRIPSGTLFVLGPMEMNQESWSDSSSRLETACLQAQTCGHRIVILVDTPSVESMHFDLKLMVQLVKPDGDDCDNALVGMVSDDGELMPSTPFARPLEVPKAVPNVATVDAMPSTVLPLLKKVLARKTTGLLVFGSTVIADHPAIDLVASALALTGSAGPVARIKPRNRGTPSKDMLVPDAVKHLPVLPSIQSAYAHGYRRMIVQSGYTDAEVMLDYADDVLFIMGTHGLESSDVYLNACRSGGFHKSADLLAHVVAVVGVGDIDAKGGIARICDMYVLGQRGLPPGSEFSAMVKHVDQNRVLRWEVDLGRLLDSKRVSLGAVRKSLGRQPNLSEFLATRSRAGVSKISAD